MVPRIVAADKLIRKPLGCVKPPRASRHGHRVRVREAEGVWCVGKSFSKLLLPKATAATVMRHLAPLDPICFFVELPLKVVDDLKKAA